VSGARGPGSANAEVAPIVVIGMGNVLLGDDGFGPCAIGVLASQWEMPAGVELIDAGTPGLDLAGLLCGREVVIFLDSVAASAAPGQLCFYRDRELDRALALKPRVSPHDPALGEALAIAGLAGSGPRSVLLVGVVPVAVEVGVGLSEPVTVAVHAAAEAVAAALDEWDAAPRRRRDRPPPALWWAADSGTVVPVAATAEGTGCRS
jgi:hydrogenase maturation protease